jgi:hypothetical protein
MRRILMPRFAEMRVLETIAPGEVFGGQFRRLARAGVEHAAELPGVIDDALKQAFVDGQR